MKKSIISVFIFLISFLLVGPIFAQTPSVTPVPTKVQLNNPNINSIVSSCGFAGVLDADRCCETIDAEKINSQITPGAGSQYVDTSIINNDTFDFIGVNSISSQCYLGEAREVNGVCTCILTTTITPIQSLTEICNKYASDKEKNFCLNCVHGGGFLTAIGCVPLQFSNFINNFLLSIGIGLAGLIALMCIIYSAFQLQTSAGNQEKIKKTQELLTSCIMGLMLIIFSVFILQLIGVRILKIPGFS